MKIWKEQMSSVCAALKQSPYTDNGWSESQLASYQRRIPLTLLRIVLLIYKEKLYGIWPMLSAENLMHRLENDPNDPEIYTLATALCGATLSHLNQSITHESLHEPLTAHSFAQEARRVRATFDYMEPVTLNTVLTSYFLHIYYGRQSSRPQTATFYIREAISFAQLLEMHTEEAYFQHSTEDQKVMRKLYFLLFMTERYLCVQYGLPTVLEPITLPTTENEDLPGVVSGFLNLVTLFSTPGNDFFSKWTSQSPNVSVSSKQLLLIQRELKLPTETPSCANDIQTVDIVATQHWLRSLAWRLSVQLGYVVPGGRQEMSVAYPVRIARDALCGVSPISMEAFEVHGPGMEAKMHEIASALADSILCQPEGDPSSSFVVGPRDILKSLSDLIFSTQVMNPELRNSLSCKLDIVLGCSWVPPAIDVTDDIVNSGMEENTSQISFPTVPFADLPVLGMDVCSNEAPKLTILNGEGIAGYS
ncbi:hypothetical protein BZG36_05372 [Bifiguratus adelaidae]|uniref:Xylanolytic transcriptional activator regulatory domain-containing protein n=1 Tax=Bifiguratus adelaidae TaxID=1938954 RepID=A0A261XUL5_9FUNG|nr:hypothetical protein BZG36_05372 [Bifiguratus adelaidae]